MPILSSLFRFIGYCLLFLAPAGLEDDEDDAADHTTENYQGPYFNFSTNSRDHVSPLRDYGEW